MGDRGRISGNQRQFQPVAIDGARDAKVIAQPDPDFTEMEMAIWQEAIFALPTDYLRAEAAPLLRSYCRTAANERRLATLVKQAEATVPFDLDHFLRMVDQHGKVAARVASLARSLRIAPSAHVDPKTAGRMISNQPASGEQMPWEG